MQRLVYILLFLLSFYSCQQNTTQGKWIKGSQKEQLEIIEWQFRGFDKAMVETDYRYQELYWAGKDKNWEYANYSVQKIKKAMITGFQRRPKREASAHEFLTIALPEIQKAIDLKDSIAFNLAFDKLTISCNTCHALEKMPFFIIKTPLHRHSSIRKN
ncbi:MAG TPA: hypothetical protein EYG92_10575 [Lutibacter sp.]|nr:hypothetical protein [Lutibacter sp.]